MFFSLRYFCCGKLLKLDKELRLFRSSSVIAFTAIILYVFTQSIITLFIMGFIAGIGQFLFRISGMTLGQAITPEDKLSEVILAGDTIVRGVTAIYSMLFIILMNHFNNNPLILFFIGFLGLAAPFYLCEACIIYKKQNIVPSLLS